MAWTYTPGDYTDTTQGTFPGSTVGDRNRVRFFIQDTNAARPLFLDEEIDGQLVSEANLYMAAASLVDLLVNRWGGIKSKKISEFQIVYDTGMYSALAAQLRARGGYYQEPYAGGISVADKRRQQADMDWVPPAISRGVTDNTAAPKPGFSPVNPLTTL